MITSRMRTLVAIVTFERTDCCLLLQAKGHVGKPKKSRCGPKHETARSPTWMQVLYTGFYEWLPFGSGPLSPKPDPIIRSKKPLRVAPNNPVTWLTNGKCW